MMYLKRLYRFLFSVHFKFFNKKMVVLSIRSNIDFKTFFEGDNKINKYVSIFGTYVGRGTYIGHDSTLNYGKIGRFCSIAPLVECVGGIHPLAPYASTHPAFFSLKKQAGFTFIFSQKFQEFRLTKSGYAFDIGNDVWIGYGVKIMESVSIGDGSVIAAGSVVTKDIPPYEIWGGAPAKKIKDRFSEVNKSKLLELKWWDKDFKELKEKAALFQDVDTLLDQINE